MNINTKLSVGDRIYRIRKVNFETVECISCEGKGKISLKSGTTLACPDCNEKGTICNQVEPMWRLADDRIEDPFHYIYGKTIENIEVDVTKKDISIKYHVANGIFGIPESEDIFGSEEEAKKECENRNRML